MHLSIAMLFSIDSFGQDQPLYNQFYFNPYLYNPSYLIDEGFEANVAYRRQWINVAGAPEIGSINLQYSPKSRLAFGLSVQSESAVALVTNTAYFTTGYTIPIGGNQSIKIGLSIGALQNTLDFDEIARSSDPSIFADPAIANAVDNTYYFASQLGINYQNDRLKIGFAFPKFFDNTAISNERINEPSFDQLQQFIASLSYDFALGQDMSFLPLLLYRHINSQQYQAEVTGIFKYKEVLWAGGGYRYEGGIIGHIGLRLTKNIMLNYSYEVPAIETRNVLGTSHEISIKLRFNKRRNEAERIIAEDEAEKDAEILQKEEIVMVEDTAANKAEVAITEEPEPQPEVIIATETVPEEPIEEVQPAEKEQPAAREVSENAADNGLSPGIYLISGVFSREANAQRAIDQNMKFNMPSDYALNKNTGLYYVYLLKTQNRSEALKMYYAVRRMNQLDYANAWILNVN